MGVDLLGNAPSEGPNPLAGGCETNQAAMGR
jgi:hypothetical protein